MDRGRGAAGFSAKRWKNQIRGKKAQAAGDYFEKSLEAEHYKYWCEGVARIQKMPVPTRSAGKGYPRHHLVPVEKTGWDYDGCIRVPGVAHPVSIVMEAKHTSLKNGKVPTRLPIDEKHLKPHQLEAMVDAYLRFGEQAWVLWENVDRYYAIGPDGLVAALAGYHDACGPNPTKGSFKSIHVDECVEWVPTWCGGEGWIVSAVSHVQEVSK